VNEFFIDPQRYAHSEDFLQWRSNAFPAPNDFQPFAIFLCNIRAETGKDLNTLSGRMNN
jgi:hypothetical protein